MQTLANSEEVWFFIECDRQARQPDFLLACDVPRVYPVGHIQEVMVIRKDDTVKRIAVREQGATAGTSFHPNHGRIFRHDGQFWLFSQRSANYEDSLFLWRIDHFELQQKAQSARLIEEFASSSRWPFRESLESLTKLEGWRSVYSDFSPRDSSFDALDRTMRVGLDWQNEYFTIQIFHGHLPSDDPLDLTFATDHRVINSAEYKNLPRGEWGHPRQPR